MQGRRTCKNLQPLDFPEPDGAVGIGGHIPAAPRREEYAAHHHAVGCAAPLELGVKEAGKEDFEPMFYFVALKITAKGLAGQLVNLGRTEAVAYQVKKEEIVQFVRADNPFGYADREICL